MKKGLFAAVALSMGMLFAVPSVALADGITMNGTQSETGSVVVDEGNSTITVSGQAALSGTGDAFVINEDASLVFSEGATLTLTGYNNAFVVENATLSGGGWNIIDGDGMDLFRLKTNGKLSINGAVTLDGAGNTNTTSRAVVLPSGSGQAVTLQTGGSLAANDFYRGMETGGASGYTISGQGMDSSTFDFGGNDCGIALSYFDSSATFKDCKLEVSDCLTSGIFMRQDNAALNGLYLTRVNINCVNPEGFEQNDIAIRFHSNNFEIIDSIINIENASTTGLWICDGWNAGGEHLISGTTITVKKVNDPDEGVSLYKVAQRRKAITFVPFYDWLINGCDITMEGSPSEHIEGGLNIASDIKLDSSTFTAKASMFGGHVKLQNSEVRTAYLDYADIGIQIGQFLEIGENVTINNDSAFGTNPNWTEHFTILCDDVENGYQVKAFGVLDLTINYDASNMSADEASPNRLTVTGGSYWSTRNESLEKWGVNLFPCSVPVNDAGEDLEMFEISPDAYSTYFSNGAIELLDKNGEEYCYSAVNPSTVEGRRFIWAPAVTVSFVDASGNTVSTQSVPRGTAFSMTAEMPEGNWNFSPEEPVCADVTVTPAA